jgi:hypothetical protein
MVALAEALLATECQIFMKVILSRVKQSESESIGVVGGFFFRKKVEDPVFSQSKVFLILDVWV